MQFLLLIYEAESVAAQRTEKENGELYTGYVEYTAAIKKEGKWLGGEALRPIETATTVRVRDGETLVTDGPFAETREQLGGFYLVDATDLDEALKLAARIPSAKYGSIEVRPIWPFDS